MDSKDRQVEVHFERLVSGLGGKLGGIIGAALGSAIGKEIGEREVLEVLQEMGIELNSIPKTIIISTSANKPESGRCPSGGGGIFGDRTSDSNDPEIIEVRTNQKNDNE